MILHQTYGFILIQTSQALVGPYSVIFASLWDCVCKFEFYFSSSYNQDYNCKMMQQ